MNDDAPACSGCVTAAATTPTWLLQLICMWVCFIIQTEICCMPIRWWVGQSFCTQRVPFSLASRRGGGGAGKDDGRQLAIVYSNRGRASAKNTRRNTVPVNLLEIQQLPHWHHVAVRYVASPVGGLVASCIPPGRDVEEHNRDGGDNVRLV